MRAGFLLTATAILLSHPALADAEQLTCSNESIVAIIADEAVSQLSNASISVFRKTIPAAALHVTLEDEYETARTDFTRQCGAMLKLSTDAGDMTQEITYEAIRTESGKDLVRWTPESNWGAALLLGLSIKSNLDQIRKRHPGISDAEANRILLYGEPGQNHNEAADIARRAAEADPTMNQGAGASGQAARPTRPAKPLPYAADPNWSQWSH